MISGSLFLNPYEFNENIIAIPTTSKSFRLYWEYLSPGSWNDTVISISLYSFVPIDIYSEVFITFEYLSEKCTRSIGSSFKVTTTAIEHTLLL
jgi:hypothetical protein